MENKIDKEDVKNLGKIKIIKDVDSKNSKTYLDYFSTDDIYCDVKKISISKKDLVREGDNGLRIPEKFLNFDNCEITYPELVNIFLFSSEINFNTSNQFSKIPVTFTAKLNQEIVIFINLHQLISSNSEGIPKICEDKSNIKIGNKIYSINLKNLEEFIFYLNNYFKKYVLGEGDSDFDFTLKNYKKISILDNIKNIFYKKNKSNINDHYLKYFLLKNKKVNVIKVYP